MTTATNHPVGDVRALVKGGAALVALSTPLNFVLLLLCCRALESLGGGYLADTSGGLVLLLAGAVSVGLFLGSCGVALLVFRRSSVPWRRIVVIIVLLLKLCGWLGWSFAAVAHMAAKGVWL